MPAVVSTLAAPIIGGNRAGFLDGRTDVAVAYSFRRLRKLYAGPLVRVRRSSDSVEQDFGLGRSAVAWSDIASFVGAGSPFLSKWYDQSGSGRDAAQATAAAQPQAGLLANSQPGMTFNGTSHALVTAGFAVNQPDSFNVVYRQVSFTQTTFQNVFDGLSSDKQTLFGLNGGSENRLYAGSTGPTGDTGVSMPVGSRGAVGGTFNGAASLMEVNAATIASFTGDTNTNALDGLTIGCRGTLTAARFDNIEMQEFILFNAGHTSAQLKADNAAMRAAWRF